MKIMGRMGDAGVVVIFVLVIAAGVVLRLVAGGMDHDRVRSYVESRGGRVLDANWVSFGEGWLGNEHEAHCKTSLFSGVYFAEDRIVHHAAADGDARSDTDAASRAAALEDENRRLREEVERLRGEQA